MGSVLSADWLETTYRSVVIAIVVLTMRKAARGFYRTRVHAGLKRSDELLPSAQWLERPRRHIPPIALGTWYATAVVIQAKPACRRGTMAPQSESQLPP